MCRGTEAGSYLRLIDSCITQLKAQGPSRTCNECKEEEEEASTVAECSDSHPGLRRCVFDSPLSPSRARLPPPPASPNPPAPGNEGGYGYSVAYYGSGLHTTQIRRTTRIRVVTPPPSASPSPPAVACGLHLRILVYLVIYDSG